MPTWAATAAIMKAGVPCLMVSTSFTSESPENSMNASTITTTMPIMIFCKFPRIAYLRFSVLGGAGRLRA